MSNEIDNDRVVPHNIYGARDAGGYVGPGEDDWRESMLTPVDAQARHEAQAVMRQTDNGAGMHYGEAIHFRNVQAKLRQVPNTVFTSRDHVVLEITYTVYTDSGNHQAHILTLTENQVRTSELGMCIMSMFQRPR